MKLNRKYNLFGGLLVSMLLLTTACAGISDLDASQVENTGKKTVTITVLPETQTGGMRAATISKGSKADILIYAVYKKEPNGNYILVTDGNVIEKGEGETTTSSGITLGAGQAYIDFTEHNKKTFTLTMKENEVYKVAFWAQSKSCDAFKTENLTEVEVKYENAKNNDEFRDAFCAVTEDIYGNKSSYSATLKRPFAQINVGTTGADYKNMMKGTYIVPNRTYTQSEITLSGVAKYINVVTDKVYDTDLENNVTFSFATIPAFMNMKELPKTEDDLLGGNDFDENTEGNTEKKAAGYKDTSNTKEEFLLVNLDGKDGYKDYKVNYPTIRTYNKGEKVEYLTETFKYLSMCYVLVPSETTNLPPNLSGKKYKSVLSNVKVSFAETKSDGTLENAYQHITLTNIPVQRNWRTNILGGLRNMKDPTDPEEPGDDEDDPNDPDPDDPEPGPDDPTSVFDFVNLKIYLDSDYVNGYIDWDEWEDITPDEEEGDDEEEEETQGDSTTQDLN